MAEPADFDETIARARRAAERLREAHREIGDELRAFVAQLARVRPAVAAPSDSEAPPPAAPAAQAGAAAREQR